MNALLARDGAIAAASVAAIALHGLLRAAWPQAAGYPLYGLVATAGPALCWGVVRKLAGGEVGADLLGAISLAVAALMGQWLVAAVLVLMLSGGAALEGFASRRASSILDALARRMPQVAHRRSAAGLRDVPVGDVAVGDALVVLPHELCPVDGVVLEGRGSMDESYLTGEPYRIAKAPGSSVLSGAVNGAGALVIVARRLARDSRYAGIMRATQDAESRRPRLRRLGDWLSFWYAPLALACAAAAGWASGDPSRFLAVLVVATPCPMLIAIPVAVIGSVSLAAGRGIVVRRPAILETITRCRTVVLDKTGTLTFGRPSVSETLPAPGFGAGQVLALAASLERYSRHPLAAAVVEAAEAAGLTVPEASEIAEQPGEGLVGRVDGRALRITGRRCVDEAARRSLPPTAAGLECVVLVDGAFAGMLRFRDVPRPESQPLLRHLLPKHAVAKILLVSGDREEEVYDLARRVGLTEVYAGRTPEQKVAIVAAESRRAPTLFVGDGINDAPALAAATVGVAIGPASDVASEAAGAVILSASLAKLDELLHIGRRMRAIALQSAVGGMALSLAGMALAAAGRLTPLEGAMFQEAVDLAAILNAIRAALPPRELTDF